MPTPKVVDGKVKYRLKTFDGSYVEGQMYESEARTVLADAETDASVPGWELRSGAYIFETNKVEMKLSKSKKQKDLDDEI